eukprot:6210489-Pleurochrysis_carterae.AAC.1
MHRLQQVQRPTPGPGRMTGSSSCWDGLGKFENRLASAQCHVRSQEFLRFCRTLPMWIVVLYEAVYTSRGPSLACNKPTKSEQPYYTDAQRAVHKRTTKLEHFSPPFTRGSPR